LKMVSKERATALAESEKRRRCTTTWLDQRYGANTTRTYSRRRKTPDSRGTYAAGRELVRSGG
jgi:hypothetical protein